MKYLIFLLLYITSLYSYTIEKVFINESKNINIAKIDDKILSSYSFSEKNLSHKAFYISKYETSYKDYKNYILNNKTKDRTITLYSDNEVLVNIDFNEAEKICKYYQGRLPNEKEWIIASSIKSSKSKCYEHLKKTSFSSYAISSYPLIKDDKVTLCLAKENEEFEIELFASELLEIKESYENINGTYGMFGNVWEWVNTDKRYFNKNYKIIKGGSFANVKNEKLFDNRIQNFVDKDTKALNIGFRCVWDIKDD